MRLTSFERKLSDVRFNFKNRYYQLDHIDHDEIGRVASSLRAEVRQSTRRDEDIIRELIMQLYDIISEERRDKCSHHPTSPDCDGVRG